ncbi:hypothetical protein [Vibrio parahaemolyticus]|uniref:hypothetical protein n=1 Tax=Vibrio parahaemolyticus TaxID=670 RepID=UPI00084A8EC9|nr:hypothetical protein [Vibrio parahaemolyticus]ODW45560.1 hypothetical protein BBL83_04790 [Vibrio parahaemolyticus]
MSNIALWQPDNLVTIPETANTAAEIAECALQLNSKDKTQISFALDNGFYEMGMNYLWSRTINALKSELSTVGVSLIGEMLGKTDVTEDDDINDIITTREAIKIAEELGMISSTEAMRLRHSHELITHFSTLEMAESEQQDINKEEAIMSLKACIKAVLGKPKVPVAASFIEFREALESETLLSTDPKVDMLQSSPYFFYKLTISVLMNAAKKSNGASLEHALANSNLLVPLMWKNLRDSEKWQVGHTYAEAFAEGKNSSVSGLKKTLLKVQGFDYVPENLRSDSFVKAADEIIKAHEGLNNFYNETAPVNSLANLGSTIPTPALPACISALLCVVLGNQYGTSWQATGKAQQLLDSLTPERWEYYLNHAFPSDTRILNKLLLPKPCENWVDEVVKKYKLDQVTIRNKNVSALVNASKRSNYSRIRTLTTDLTNEYYGKRAK